MKDEPITAIDETALGPPSPAASGKRRLRRGQEVLLIVFISLAIFSLLALASYSSSDPSLNSHSESTVKNLIGPVGAYFSDALYQAVGKSAFLLPLLFLILAFRFLTGRRIIRGLSGWIGYVSLIFWGAVACHLLSKGDLGNIGGGLLGRVVGDGLIRGLHMLGATLITTACLLIALSYATSIPLMRMLKRGWRGLRGIKAFFQQKAVIARERHRRNREKSLEKKQSDNQPRIAPRLRPSKKSLEMDKAPQPAQLKAALPKAVKSTAQEKSAPEDGAPTAAVDLDDILQHPAAESSYSEAKIVAGHTRSRPNADRATQTSFQFSDTSFELPPLSLLEYDDTDIIEYDEESLRTNAAMLIQKLKDFKIDGKVTQIHPGPVVTMYEFQPAPGIKISKVEGLSDDLAMALEAVRVRIVAPIPGKNAIGIEVSNKRREMVYLQEIFANSKFQRAQAKLSFALGKDIKGKPVIGNLEKMPHLLVAGTTGSGKSVFINSLIVSLLYKSTPDDVRMILVDPKILELSRYQNIPHLLLPVVNDPKKAALALRWAVDEMERRYHLLADYGVQNIKNYNTKVERLSQQQEETGKKVKKVSVVRPGKEPPPPQSTELDASMEELPEKLPYIVVIIDEYADLMMVAPKDVEFSVTRLAQKARAAGIHLVLATQRPSIKVITGLIKGNLPARISFQVSTMQDSRVILDHNGAEKLLGAGDMLFLEISQLKRVHGAFISDEEATRVAQFWSNQSSPRFDETILAMSEKDDEEEREAALGPVDSLYDEALNLVAQSQSASISMIQRRLQIGYNRAARMVERMETDGLVGPPIGSKPREVFMPPGSYQDI